MQFTWDPAKAEENLLTHSVSFQEATTVFGQSSAGQLLVVCHVEQGDTIRLISARRATLHERKDYETYVVVIAAVNEALRTLIRAAGKGRGLTKRPTRTR